MRIPNLIMNSLNYLPLLMVLLFVIVCGNVKCENYEKYPTIQIITLFRNKGHTLPYFFTYLENLNYPKDRISLWFRSDHNEDNTIEIINTWLSRISSQYHHIDFKYNNSNNNNNNNINNKTIINPNNNNNNNGDDENKQHRRRSTELSLLHWPIERHMDVIRLKEEGLNDARQNWADYAFFLDADIFLTLPNTLKNLLDMHLPIVSPMLLSDGLYSNFWAGMSEDFYYERTDEYKEIYNYVKHGEFIVPMIHSVVLVNLRDIRADRLTFNKTKLLTIGEPAPNAFGFQLKNIPIDDIIIFAIAANLSGMPMYISNSYQYGYIMVPLDQDDTLAKDYEQLTNIKIFIVNDLHINDIVNETAAVAVVVTDDLQKYVKYPEMDRMTLSKMYMINLERRTERKRKMEQSFIELGLQVDNVAAIDGHKLSDKDIANLGIKFLPGYADPYHNRPMTLGEIGCFLSHYNIWLDMIEKNITDVLVLEDDIRFEPYFKERSINLLNEARAFGLWNLIYFGRKRLENQQESWVFDSQQLVSAGYSYWTLGYVLNLEGAKKLIDAKPLENLIPVDEFLPIMFNQHINDTWKHYFPNKNLIAWSADPLLLYPTHYTGETGYISDTEDSIVIQLEHDDDQQKEKKGDKENLIMKDNNNNSLLDDEKFIHTNHNPNYLLNTVTESITGDTEQVHSEL